VAEAYRRELEGVKGLALPPEDTEGKTQSVYHMFVIRLDVPDQRDALARWLREQGIETGVHYPVPCHLQPAILDLYGTAADLPKTEEYVKRILSLPMFPTLSEDEVRRVATAIRQFLKR
jgi:dTDP-4-amino-4,6-dideoxygalactose transaminase